MVLFPIVSLVTVLGIQIISTQEAQAQLAPFLTKTGSIHVSVDGAGTNLPGGFTIDVDRPSAASTVSSAHVVCANVGFSGAVINDNDIVIGGIPVAGFAQVTNGVFNNFLADVTASHGALLNGAPVGISSLAYSEVNTFGVDGCTLVVIWDFPEAPVEQTAILFFGGQSTTGDQFVVSLGDPIDKTDPNSKLDFGLGISFGAQDLFGPAGSNLCGQDSSMNFEVDINGVRLTSCAGNADDGNPAENMQNGLLYTVGGIGDSNANPISPLLGAPQPLPGFVEDELYSLLPLVNDGDTQIIIDTLNPSNDDNIHFAWLCTLGRASVGQTLTKEPDADAGGNITIHSSQQLSTTLNGTASDPNNDPLTYRWLESATELLASTPVVGGLAPLDLSLLSPLSIGAHTLTLEADDGLATATDDMILTIENSPPVVAPSGGGTFQLGNNITLSGNVSDFDGDGLDYRWFEGISPDFTTSFIGTIAAGTPVVLPDFDIIGGLPLGNHVITLEADDGTNSPVSDDITVSVIDTTAPTISATVSPGILWPPNHKMVDVVIQANTNDNSGSVTLTASVSSSELPDTDGDGNTIPDHTTPVIDQTTGQITLQLRSERKGQGTGRTYTITMTATDGSGNSSGAIIEVVAPHDKGKK